MAWEDQPSSEIICHEDSTREIITKHQRKVALKMGTKGLRQKRVTIWSQNAVKINKR